MQGEKPLRRSCAGLEHDALDTRDAFQEFLSASAMLDSGRAIPNSITRQRCNPHAAADLAGVSRLQLVALPGRCAHSQLDHCPLCATGHVDGDGCVELVVARLPAGIRPGDARGFALGSLILARLWPRRTSFSLRVAAISASPHLTSPANSRWLRKSFEQYACVRAPR